MKTENKFRLMVWAIAILIVLNVTTIITVVYNKNQVLEREPELVSTMGVSENTSVKYSGRYFREALGLSMDQMKKFSEFNPVFRQEVILINRVMAEKRHAMLIEMARNNCDTNKLNMLSDSIGNLHAALKKSTYKYYLDFKNICNPQQQQKLEQLFGEIFSSDMLMGEPGRVFQGGRRAGWRRNSNL